MSAPAGRIVDVILLWVIKKVCEQIMERIPEEEAEEEWALCRVYLNMTEPPEPKPIQLEDVSKTSKIILLTLYTITILLAVLGNLCVLVFSGSRQFRSVNSVFIVSLAISDLLLTLLCMPFNMINIVNRTWEFGDFGEFACKNIPYVQMTTVSATWLTITCISLERYVAVLHPMRSKSLRRRSRTLVVTILVWIVSAAMAVPNLLLYDFITIPYHSPEDEELFIHMCIVPTEKRHMLVTYRWFNVVTLLVPVIWMTFAYICVVHRLWIRKSVSTETSHHHVDPGRLTLYRRVVKAVVAVMVLFFLCWTPTILFEAIAVTIETEATEAMLNVRYYLHWLANSNAFHNPIVYTLLHANLARNLRGCCQRCGCARVKVYPEVVEPPVATVSAQVDRYHAPLTPRPSRLTPTFVDNHDGGDSTFTPTT